MRNLSPRPTSHGRRPGTAELATETCDGVHPRTGQPCVLGRHKGYHRTADGLRWLDD